jgi:hypothetical protein
LGWRPLAAARRRHAARVQDVGDLAQAAPLRSQRLDYRQDVGGEPTCCSLHALGAFAAHLVEARGIKLPLRTGTGDGTKLVLNNLISIFRYYEKEPKKAKATAAGCYIASKYKLGAERNYWMS